MGWGKTSLLKALAGTHPRSGGQVFLGGEAIGVVPAQGMVKRGLALVPQGWMTFPLLSRAREYRDGLCFAAPRPASYPL